MYDLNPFRQAKQILENERLAKQDPREFASEPFDPEDTKDANLRNTIEHHHYNWIMHSALTSDPSKSQEERAEHAKQAKMHLKEKLANMNQSGIVMDLSNDPRDVPEHIQAQPNFLPSTSKKQVEESEEIEELLDIIDALCEEIGIDSDELFEGYGYMTKGVHRQYRAIADYRDRAAKARGERRTLGRNHQPIEIRDPDDFDKEEDYNQLSDEEQKAREQARRDPRKFPPGSPKTKQKIANLVAKRFGKKVPKEWKKHDLPSK